MSHLSFLFIFFFSSLIAKEDLRSLLIIWNVGQGQWVTFVSAENCVHLDTGGERTPKKLIKNFCDYKKNWLYFTHGDWDHINRLSFFKSENLNYCIKKLPREHLNTKKLNWLLQHPICLEAGSSRELVVLNKNVSCKRKDNNCFSYIYQWQNQVLIPGDSPKKSEKRILTQLHPKVEVLILGHHGSQTSTSQKLLSHLSHLNMSVASSRSKKYGHPHKTIIERLQKNKTPLLTTEEWGSIILEL